jgi:hypothetical protein
MRLVLAYYIVMHATWSPSPFHRPSIPVNVNFFSQSAAWGEAPLEAGARRVLVPSGQGSCPPICSATVLVLCMCLRVCAFILLLHSDNPGGHDHGLRFGHDATWIRGPLASTEVGVSALAHDRFRVETSTSPPALCADGAGPADRASDPAPRPAGAVEMFESGPYAYASEKDQEKKSAPESSAPLHHAQPALAPAPSPPQPRGPFNAKEQGSEDGVYKFASTMHMHGLVCRLPCYLCLAKRACTVGSGVFSQRPTHTRTCMHAQTVRK